MAKIKSDAEDRFKSSLIQSFSVLPDPRVTGRCAHLLLDLVAICVCSVLCGCENWVEIEEFALLRQNWFRRWLKLPGGIPSHDTFSRTFSLLEPRLFEMIFFKWAESIRGGKPLRSIALDGKSVSGTHRRFNDGKKRLHLLNVLCTESGLTLGQLKASSSGNAEVNAALECLEALKIKGTLITVDAGLAARRLTDKILEKGGDYLIPIKRNQRLYLRELEDFFKIRTKARSEASTEEWSHGRKENRAAVVRDAKVLSEKFRTHWGNPLSVIRIVRKREMKDVRYVLQKTGRDGKQSYRVNPAKIRTKTTTIYYISSRKVLARDALSSIRKHWRIENDLHWRLDVVFKEDHWRVRNQVAAENLSLLRKFAFNLLKQAPGKGSMRIKMKRAGWNEGYLEEVLFEKVAI